MESDMAKFSISTKVNKSAPAVITVLEVVMDATPEVRDALALAALVVKVQGQWRKHGIPATCSIKMSEFAPGTRHVAAPMSKDEAKAIWKAEFNAANAERRAEMVLELTTS
jgi:hypothetical protein